MDGYVGGGSGLVGAECIGGRDVDFDKDFVWAVGGRGEIGGGLYRKSHFGRYFFQGFQGGDGGMLIPTTIRVISNF